jgi:hypothetical protein
MNGTLQRDNYGNLQGEYKTRTCPHRLTRDYWLGDIMTADDTWNGIPDGDTYTDPFPPDEHIPVKAWRPMKTVCNWTLEIRYKGNTHIFDSARKCAEFLNMSDDNLRQRLRYGLIPDIKELAYIIHEGQKITKKSSRKQWTYIIETDYSEKTEFTTMEKAAAHLHVRPSTFRDYLTKPSKSLIKKGITSITRRQRT